MPNTMSTSIRDHMPSIETIEASVAENGGWFTAMGVILMLTGAAAIGFPLASSIAVEFIIGFAFAIAGLVYTAQAFGARGVGGFFFHVIAGLVYLAAGVFLMAKPIEGTAVLTFVVAISFIADGVTRTAISMVMRQGAWGWMLLGGLVAIVLGVGVLAMFPVTAVWVLGVLAGINLLTSGLAFVMLAVSVDEESKDAQPAKANT